MIKIKLIAVLIFLSSCGYPDIDSVPNFKEVELTQEEIIDLCQLSSADKSEIDECVLEKQKK